MGFEEAQPVVDEHADQEPVRREPDWLLPLGIVLFLGLLTFIWWHSGTRSGTQAYALAQGARANTYLVAYFQYETLKGTALSRHLEPFLARTAAQTADVWRAAGAQADDADYRARTALNAAALYGVAGNAAEARAALLRAAEHQPSKADVYRALLPLYHSPPAPVVLSPQADAELNEVSTGALIRARNAQAAGNTPAALAALQPAADAGMRYLTVIGILGALVIGIILAAIIIFIAAYSRITQSFAAVHAADEASPPWGVGAALIVISINLFLTILLTNIAFALSGVDPADTYRYLLIYAPATVVSTVLVLGVFLLSLGRKPWEWGVFGWRLPARGVWYGVAALLITYPVVWVVSVMAGIIFRDRVETHPLVPLLQTTRDPWLVLLMVAMAVVMAPVVEETLFRGVLFRALGARLHFWWAALLSGVLFAVIHGQLVAILPITVLGVLFAFITRRTQALWGSALAHAIFNGITTLAVLLLAWALRTA